MLFVQNKWKPHIVVWKPHNLNVREIPHRIVNGLWLCRADSRVHGGKGTSKTFLKAEKEKGRKMPQMPWESRKLNSSRRKKISVPFSFSCSLGGTSEDTSGGNLVKSSKSDRIQISTYADPKFSCFRCFVVCEIVRYSRRAFVPNRTGLFVAKPCVEPCHSSVKIWREAQVVCSIDNGISLNSKNKYEATHTKHHFITVKRSIHKKVLTVKKLFTANFGITE